MSVSRFAACAVLAALLPTGARAEIGSSPTVFEVPVPGGIRAALSVIKDPAAPDRGQFMLDVIRRFHNRAPGEVLENSPGLPALLAHLEKASQADVNGVRETVPLPLTPEIWTNIVFGGRVATERLVSAILASPSASQLYCGLLSLDDETRSWLSGRPNLVAYLAGHAASFLVASPALRVRNGRLQLPGGTRAEAAWRKVVGAGADDPHRFIHALIQRREQHLAFFLSAMAQLNPAMVGFAFNLDSPDPDASIASARRLHSEFERIVEAWNMDQRPFWRPALDPAFLLAQLPADEAGRPVLPMQRRFWTRVFADPDDNANEPSKRSTSPEGGDLVDFAWLCARIFDGPPIFHRRRYNMTLFASRNAERITAETEDDAVEAVRAVSRYPALIAVLERAGVRSLAAFAAAPSRARRLTAIEDDTRAFRSLAQFQGAVALVARAAMRGGYSQESLSSLVSSLSAVETSREGDYEARLVRWIDAHLVKSLQSAADGEPSSRSAATRPERPDEIELALIRLAAGSSTNEPRFVDWEGTRYRLDLASAEASRISRLLGEDWHPSFSSALRLADLADALLRQNASAGTLRASSETFGNIATGMGLDDMRGKEGHQAGVLEADALALSRKIAGEFRDADGRGSLSAPSKVAADLRALADNLAARGLVELAYAVALGEAEPMLLSVREIAGRHDFGLLNRLAHRDSRAWHLPATLALERAWHVTGSVLGLEVKLAQYALRRVSSRPPLRRPSLNEIDRSVFIEAVGLAQPAALRDEPRTGIVEALRRGREKLAAIRTAADVVRLGDTVQLGGIRRTLLAWTLAHEPTRVPASLSLAELVWLGREPTASAATFSAWGAPGEPRLGCLCPSFPGGATSGIVEGRWDSGTFASAFPDLNLRLAELLSELNMPSGLLAPVLAAATIDFVENTISRDRDDRRGLLEFVEALDREHVEQYLALLTSGGPLVPLGETANAREARELK